MPSKPFVKKQTPTSVTVFWKEDEFQGSKIETFTISQYKLLNESLELGSQIVIEATSLNRLDLSHTIVGLARDTTYKFRVAATNQAGQSVFSEMSNDINLGNWFL